MQGNYTVNGLKFDMRNMFDLIPFPEGLVTATLKFVKEVSMTKRIIFSCLQVEVKFLNKQQGRKS